METSEGERDIAEMVNQITFSWNELVAILRRLGAVSQLKSRGALATSLAGIHRQ